MMGGTSQAAFKTPYGLQDINRGGIGGISGLSGGVGEREGGGPRRLVVQSPARIDRV